MSDDDRSTRTALIISFIAAVVVLSGTLFYAFQIGALKGRYDADASGYAAHYPHDTQQQIVQCWSKAGRDAALDCVNEAIESSRESQRSELDLSAQQQMSEWAFWALLVSMCSSLVTAIGTYLLYQQIILTRRAVNDTSDATAAMEVANQIARESLDRQNRAWVSLEVTPGQIWMRRSEFSLVIAVDAKNISNTICTSIVNGNVTAQVFPKDEIENIYQIASITHPEWNKPGAIILPNDSRSSRIAATVGTIWKQVGSEVVMIDEWLLVVKIQYGWPGATSPGTTCKVYEIAWTEPGDQFNYPMSRDIVGQEKLLSLRPFHALPEYAA